MQRINRWVGELTQRNPWTNVYGLSRSIFALGTAGTLTVSEASTLFAPIPSFLDPPRCSGLAGDISLFCLVPIDRFDLARRVALVVLLVVASGWRPRVTGYRIGGSRSASSRVRRCGTAEIRWLR